MARSIKLPARANALVYGDAEVIDVLLTLHNTANGDAVVIDDATDTEPKARVRCRAMAKLLESERTVTVDDLPESGEFGPEWMTEMFEAVGAAPAWDAAWTTDDLAAVADERGITVEGTGKDGHVLKADIIRALTEWDAAQGEDEPQGWTVPGIAVRTHVVQEGEGYLPVLSPKA